MPGFATHYLFGVSAIQEKKHTMFYQQIIHHPTVFGLGLQGPDLFFYDLPIFFRNQVNPGTAAHQKKTGSFLYHLIESRKIFTHEDEKEIASAYILGFLGHYTLDTTCHPYIYGRTHFTSEDNAYFGRHVYLETDIDAFLLAQYKKMLPSSFHQERTIRLNAQECRVVASILHYVYDMVFPEQHLSYRDMHMAVRFMEFAVWALRDPHGKKKALTRLMERNLLNYAYASPLIASDNLRFTRDPMNLSHKLWRNPWNKAAASSDTFFDLLHQAKIQYKKRLSLCERLFRCDTPDYFLSKDSPSDYDKLLKKLQTELGDLSYSSGLKL